MQLSTVACNAQRPAELQQVVPPCAAAAADEQAVRARLQRGQAAGQREQHRPHPGADADRRVWQADTPAAIWNRIADDLAQRHEGSVLGNARALARMIIALADATIAIWNAKNPYDTWRPITAIEQAATDGNPATSPDPTWSPLITTPAFQEYPAGHPGVSNAAASVLATDLRRRHRVHRQLVRAAGVERTFTSFSSAVAQVENARVWGGIHFRFATLAAARIGDQVADYVTSTQLVRVDPAETGEPNQGPVGKVTWRF